MIRMVCTEYHTVLAFCLLSMYPHFPWCSGQNLDRKGGVPGISKDGPFVLVLYRFRNYLCLTIPLRVIVREILLWGSLWLAFSGFSKWNYSLWWFGQTKQCTNRQITNLYCRCVQRNRCIPLCSWTIWNYTFHHPPSIHDGLSGRVTASSLNMFSFMSQLVFFHLFHTA